MNLIFHRNVSNTKKVRISLASKYVCGHGWRTESDKCQFHKTITELFREAGFRVKEGQFLSECASLYSNNAGTRIYLHPMEFTGYATQTEIDVIITLLNRVVNPEIVRITKVILEDVYDISDEEYIEILNENKDFIATWVKLYKYQHKYTYNIDEDFLNTFRIPRVGDKSCLYSGGVDYEWFNANFTKTPLKFFDFTR